VCGSGRERSTQQTGSAQATTKAPYGLKKALEAAAALPWALAGSQLTMMTCASVGLDGGEGW
jgi:hypothetical protein